MSSLPVQFASCLDTIRQNYIMLDDANNIFDSKPCFNMKKIYFYHPIKSVHLNTLSQNCPSAMGKFLTEGTNSRT